MDGGEQLGDGWGQWDRCLRQEEEAEEEFHQALLFPPPIAPCWWCRLSRTARRRLPTPDPVSVTTVLGGACVLWMIWPAITAALAKGVQGP